MLALYNWGSVQDAFMLTERLAVGAELGAGLMSNLCKVVVDAVRVSIKSLARSSLTCKQ